MLYKSEHRAFCQALVWTVQRNVTGHSDLWTLEFWTAQGRSPVTTYEHLVETVQYSSDQVFTDLMKYTQKKIPSNSENLRKFNSTLYLLAVTRCDALPNSWSEEYHTPITVWMRLSVRPMWLKFGRSQFISPCDVSIVYPCMTIKKIAWESFFCYLLIHFFMTFDLIQVSCFKR